jgi:hypothetical protein
MKITELLCIGFYWVEGYKTRIMTYKKINDPSITIFLVFGKSESDRYIINLYHGDSEEEAVKAFVENENIT